MKQFRLFKHESGAFEVVPIGWSLAALCLNVIWAVQNGLFLQFFRFFFPAIITMIAGMWLLDLPGREAVGLACVIAAVVFGNGFVVYFSVVAYDWKADQLIKNGYEEIASIRGRTSQQALANWARSKQADCVLDAS